MSFKNKVIFYSIETMKKNTESLNQKIEEAWTLRWTQQMEACLKRFPEIKTELGLPLYGLKPEEFRNEVALHAKNEVEAIERADTILLSASIYRAQGKVSDASELIDVAREILESVGIIKNFRLHFEQGLLRFSLGDSFTALEDFFSAASSSTKNEFRLIALTNASLCLENLGMNYSESLHEARELMKICEPTHPLVKANEAQLRALKLREYFRAGKIRELILDAKRTAEFREKRIVDQPSYYSLWVKALPYHAHFDQTKSEGGLDFLKSDAWFYQRGYRIRTLHTLLHPDDDQPVRLSDRIERAYLWTWLWIKDGGDFPPQKLMVAINQTLAHLDHSRIAEEDRIILRNTLGWLSLIDASLEIKLRPILNRLKSGSAIPFPLLEFEWACIQYMKAISRSENTLARDSLLALESHPLWGMEDLYFRPLIETFRDNTDKEIKHEAPAWIQNFAQRLRQLITPEKSENSSRILVDLNTFLVQDRKNDRKTVSQPMAIALKLLRDRSAITCEDLAKECFGITRFDSFIHMPKIFNLIARMRQLGQTSVRFKVKSGSVLSEGSWNEFEMIHPHELSVLLRGENLGVSVETPTQAPIGRKPHKEVLKLLEALKNKENFSSDDVRHVLETSRATTTRLINRLLKKNKISKIGSGRSTRYKFT